MISTIAGIMSAIGNSLTFIIRNPVARRSTPPQALKSPIISGVQKGKITFASANSIRKMIICGIAINDVTAPSVHAKISAVGRSRIDFAKRMLWSPVIPETMLP